MKKTVLVLSCEHAVNTVPQEYAHIFKDQENVLTTYQAVDLGALDITKRISQALECDYTYSPVTRLLIDCNQDSHQDRCFSDFTKKCDPELKQTLLNQYHTPYREKIQNLVQSHIDNNDQVLHLSIHSFHCTPSTENTALGLLYNCDRHGEREVVRIWRGLLSNQRPLYRIRINHPNESMNTSFTSSLRLKHPEADYLGIVLEINQCLINQLDWEEHLAQVLSNTLKELLQLL
jgi:predicted N-formylglutamate amidohydrolase